MAMLATARLGRTRRWPRHVDGWSISQAGWPAERLQRNPPGTRQLQGM